MDKKGIFVYLGVTYAGAFLLIPLLMHMKLIVFTEPNILNNIVFLLAMWIPALGAVIAAKASPNDAVPRFALWPLPKGPAVRIALVVLLAYAVTYTIGALFGWTRVQWDMGTLMNQISGTQQQPLPPGVTAIAPAIALVGGLIISVLLGLTVFAFLALGSELGWRGYLLPRLMPLGRFRAYAMTGVLWGLWFLPLIYGSYREIGQPPVVWITALEFVAMGVALSAVLGEIWRRTGHLGLVAVAAGSFAVHLQGIWDHLFQMGKDPWTGPFGVIAILVWTAVALLPGLMSSRKPQTGTGQPEGQA